jgi:hypothetical protein
MAAPKIKQEEGRKGKTIVVSDLIGVGVSRSQSLPLSRFGGEYIQR